MTFVVRRVAVIGAGTMGHGIAQAAAQAGWEVALTDARADALAAGLKSVARNLDGAVSRGKLTPEDATGIQSRVQGRPTVADACRDCDLVIEAVVEDAQVKQAVLTEAARAANEQALIASNTSSLSITDLAHGLPRPERALGLHFFNPVHVMKLVEIVTHEGTTPEAKADALAVVAAMGKEAIVVRDSPGFASSRLGVALGLEAMRMLEEKVASARDIDRAMELGYNHPMGPLKLTDLVGLDVRLRIAEYLHRTLGDARYEPPAILKRMVDEGRLGKKSGKGFYDWPES
jgi:3-hydroxybutyryl-CoA dehydrogenase